jgi:precorrin-2 dehydrogenase/sirohydrochlorin ferrochelatase
MKPMYGMFVNLAGRPCLVVGGGSVAERKITGLLECGAAVTVIAPTATPGVETMAQRGTIKWEARKYRSGDAERFFLVMAATDSVDVNRQVFAEAEAAGRLVNVANDQDAGNFAVPAMLRRGRLQVAVSTSGASPAAARRIRDELAERLGVEYADFLDRLANVRQVLQETVTDGRRRAEILNALVRSELLQFLREGRHEEADELVANFVGRHT